LRTIFGRAIGHLNNVPMAYTVKSKVDFNYLPLTLGHFLVGSAYAELQPIDTENTKLTNATRYNRVCSVLELFWKRLVAELTTHLNNWISKTRGVKIGDIALLLDSARRGATPLVRIARVQMGTDGEIQRMVCFDGFTCFGRAMASIVIRCSRMGIVHLKMIDYMDTSSFLLAVKRLLALRPRPSVFIADSGTSFKGGDLALQGITEKGAPHFLGLVERFVGAARVAIRSAVHAHTLTDEELRTVFGRAMGRLNNVPMAYTVKSKADFHCMPLNPGRFLVRSAYAELQPVDTENAKLTNATR
jgi:hypothetical protein